jgi:hypothetical protein
VLISLVLFLVYSFRRKTIQLTRELKTVHELQVGGREGGREEGREGGREGGREADSHTNTNILPISQHLDPSLATYKHTPAV